jgi:hypothetical protein
MQMIRTKHLILTLLFASLYPLLTACSVGMAVSGEENPDLSVVAEGCSRVEIERELGAPQSVRELEGGDLECQYRYEIGDEPSAARAAGHATLDVLTIGLWELVGTPTELSQGDEFELTVVYGSDGIAKEVKTRQIE